MLSLLNDPTLGLMLIKSALRLVDRRCLNELQIDELFDNVMYFSLESALCVCVAKKHHKTLRREFGTRETDKRLLMEECSRMKVRIDEVEGTIKETLESMDKLPAKLNEANASKLVVEHRAKSVDDQWAYCISKCKSYKLK